jgi:hypothetical protein
MKFEIDESLGREVANYLGKKRHNAVFALDVE